MAVTGDGSVRAYEWAAGVLIWRVVRPVPDETVRRAELVIRVSARRGFDPLSLSRRRRLPTSEDERLLAALPGTAGTVARKLGLSSSQAARQLLERAAARGLVVREPTTGDRAGVWRAKP